MNPSVHKCLMLALAISLAYGAGVPLAAISGGASHPAVHPGKAHRIKVAHRRQRIARVLHAHLTEPSATRPQAQAPVAPAPSRDTTSVTSGTVHYEHGPEGLTDDVGTVGVVKRF